jgi:hypothetical protein
MVVSRNQLAMVKAAQAPQEPMLFWEVTVTEIIKGPQVLVQLGVTGLTAVVAVVALVVVVAVANAATGVVGLYKMPRMQV